MSRDSIKAYRFLIDKLRKQPGNGNSYTEEQAKLLWEYRSEFKRTLRKDIFELTKI